MRLVREKAAEFGYRPDRVGMIGFSAGGMVTSEALFGPKETRPDFVALIYGIREIKAIPDPAPPLFLAVAADDAGFVSQTVDLFTAYRKAKGFAELHVFQSGAHGFVNKGGGADHFMDRLEEWLSGPISQLTVGLRCLVNATILGSIGGRTDSFSAKWTRIMPGPAPLDRPAFPPEFLEQCRGLVRRRAISHERYQGARLALLLHESPAMSNASAAGTVVEMHPNSVRLWRRRWAQGYDFSLGARPGRAWAKARFSPSRPGRGQGHRL